MPEPHDENFVQQRLLLASLLSAAAFLAYFYLQSQLAPPPPPAETPAAAATDPEPGSPPESAAEPTIEAETVVVPGEIRAEREREVVVETDEFRVVFSNRGAVVKSWVLKDYRDARREPLELVHQSGAARYGWPFELTETGGEPIAALRDALFAVNDGPDQRSGEVELSFEYSDGVVRARKIFRFNSQGYVFNLESEYSDQGRPRRHLIAWPGGFGDTEQTQDWINNFTFYYDLEAEEIVKNDVGDAEDGRLTNTGAYPFAGIEDLFFTAAFFSEAETAVSLETGAIQIRPLESEEREESFIAGAVGSLAPRNAFQVYVGPKDVDELQAVDPRLRGVVDLGFFSFVAEPLFLMMRWTHANVVSNWGWTIVLVTVFINIALFPLKWKGSKSMKRMQAIQPLVKEINAKYEGMGMRDPRRAKQNEEIMELYKKYSVNPVGGCFPMLLQLPFFYGFYVVLTAAIEMRQADWLWVADLSRPEQISVRILPLAMMGTQFLMQSMTPTPSADPTQARIMKFFPLMMGFIFYGFQSGLVLYWLTSNIVGIGQQALINKMPGEDLQVKQPRRPAPAKRKKPARR